MKPLPTWRLVPTAIALATLLLTPVAAATYHYQESNEGDLTTGGLMPFDLGLNTVSGRMGYMPASDYDSFGFRVPTHAKLVSAQVTLTDVEGDLTSSQWSLRTGSTIYMSGFLVADMLVSSPGVTTVTGISTLGKVFNVSHQFLTAGAGGANYSDYTFSFRVHLLVPEPATSAMLFVGVAAVGCRRLRNAKRQQSPT